MSFLDLAMKRFSCRSYENRPVEDDVLAQVLEAGRIAPSAHNNHPTRVIVCNTPELREKAAKAAFRFERDGSVFGAPVVLVVCADIDRAWERTFDHMNAAEIDSSIVCDHMMMEATELGLGTCWVCMFDPDIAHDAFELPDTERAISMLTLGYPAETIAPKVKREARRIPLDQFLDVRA